MIEKIAVNCVAVMRSRYNTRDKIRIFKVLSVLYLKSRINRNNIHAVTYNILGFVVTAPDYSTLNYLFKEIFLSEEYYFESNHARPSIADCGANIGMSILYFKFLYPDCRIVAFEPNPLAFALLTRNIAQNNLKNIDLHNIGLSDVKRTVQFFVGDDKGGLSSSMLRQRDGKNVVDIQTGRLSDFVQNASFDLIKMDIEGAETQVLNDLVSTNKLGNAERYIVEYHHKIDEKKSSLSTFVNPFEEIGFEYNLRTTYQQTGEFQDVLLNFYRDAGQRREES
jgi:FkbM family methyltransferase